ncbi:MAG: diguanylate cyclase [Acidimicrobiales bacterium]
MPSPSRSSSFSPSAPPAAWTHASEQRHIATAASDLQVAAMTLAAADSLLLDGEQPGGLQLGHAVLALSTNREMALRPLSPGDANRANELLDEIAANSLTLLDHGARGHEIHGHGELHDLLAHAADEAESGAIAAEQRALGAVVLASLAVMVGFWLVLKSRFRSEHDRERAELQAREGRRLEALLDDSPDSAFVIDLGGRIVYRSESGNRLLGLEFGAREDLVALASPAKRDALRDHLRRADASGDSAVFSLRDQSGVWGWYQIRVSDLSDNRTVDGHVVTARNITNEVLLRDELQRQADTDHLTGLPNRRVLQRALVTASNRLTECGGLTAVMTLDIDGFKSINDTLGHAAGDELLIRVAERLNGAKAEDHVLLRLGGDEFALIAPSVASVADAETQARALLAAFDDPFRLGSRVERVRTSVGVATTAEPSRVDGLLREADVALYESKRRGGSSVVMHDPLVADSSARTDRIAAALRTADHDAEFHVMYQPIVEIHSGTVTGLEALLRWTSPELGPVSPDEFVPVAETTGDICEIGKWVIDSVFCQFAAWIEAGIDPSITVSFNVSPRQLADERFVPCVGDGSRGRSSVEAGGRGDRVHRTRSRRCRHRPARAAAGSRHQDLDRRLRIRLLESRSAADRAVRRDQDRPLAPADPHRDAPAGGRRRHRCVRHHVGHRVDRQQCCRRQWSARGRDRRPADLARCFRHHPCAGYSPDVRPRAPRSRATSARQHDRQRWAEQSRQRWGEQSRTSLRSCVSKSSLSEPNCSWARSSTPTRRGSVSSSHSSG